MIWVLTIKLETCSIVKDSLKFDYIFPNTDVSCGYVIRYFFHTNIHLGKESNKLISMNGSIFNFENIDINEEREYNKFNSVFL